MKKKTLTQVPLEVSLHLTYLHQDKGIREKELLKMYPKLSKTTIYRHAKKPVADKTVDKLKHNYYEVPIFTSAMNKSIFNTGYKLEALYFW